MIMKVNPEIKIFLNNINRELLKRNKKCLSKTMISFIAICMTGCIYLGMINISAFSRATLGKFTKGALYWMFHYSKINFSDVFRASLIQICRIFKITGKVKITIDDTDRGRSKIIKKIFNVFKTLDKKTGGFFFAQNIVFIAMVTKRLTIPIGFTFFKPDPEITKWNKNDKKLKKQGVSKKDRPKKPKRNRKKYPTKIDIALKLLSRAQKFIEDVNKSVGTDINIISILADSAYMSPSMCNFVKNYFPKAQFISQLANNQIVWNKNGKKKSVKEYFKNIKPVETNIKLRGQSKIVEYCSARLFVKSHGKKRHIVALKYEGETEYRYLIATDLTWRTEDIIKSYSFRWLIEVVIEDWKQYNGFGRKASQQGADGACTCMFLSLLVDHFLLTHPYQLRLFRSGQSLCTIGSLVRRIQHEGLLKAIEDIFEDPNPQAALKRMANNVQNIFTLRPSKKHISSGDEWNYGPSKNLERIYK